MGKSDDGELLESFLKIGLNEKTAKNALVNSKLSTNLKAVIDEANVSNGCDMTVGNLLYMVATKFPANALIHRPLLLKYIVTLEIKKQDQLEAAILFLEKKGSENIEVKDFEVACGVGHYDDQQYIISKYKQIIKSITSSRGSSSSDFPSWVKSKDRKLLQDVSDGTKADIVVSLDGSPGTVNSLKKAIDMAPIKSTKRFVIFVKKGKYVENVIIDKKKQNVMLIGEGMDKTIISGNLNVKDGMRTFSSATFAVTGSSFIARDIGFENTAGAIKEQAVAVRVGSDRSVFYRCRFDGYQDTLYAHSNRQFYKDCTISGTIDFIFGNAAVVFQSCTILARQPLNNQKNTITAQGRTDPNQNTGISIHASQILPQGNAVTSPTYLGRPWKPYCLTVIMRTQIGGFVNGAGWMSWDGSNNPPADTIFYGEYQNTGPGSGTENRVKWKGYYPAISDSVAGRYTVQSFIGGNEWIASTGTTYSLGL